MSKTIKGYGWKGVILCPDCKKLVTLDKEHNCKPPEETKDANS